MNWFREQEVSLSLPHNESASMSPLRQLWCPTKAARFGGPGWARNLQRVVFMKFPKGITSIRHTSKLTFFGHPLLAVASGPSSVVCEPLGHARGSLVPWFAGGRDLEQPLQRRRSPCNVSVGQINRSFQTFPSVTRTDYLTQGCGTDCG